MISEYFIGLFQAIVEWVIGLFGTDDPPQWLTEVGGFLAELFARAAGLGAWFPFAFFALVYGTYIGLWLALWIVKAVRWLWGLTPFSGGS